MTRVLGTFGLGGVFFLISPQLRASLSDGLTAIGDGMDRYAPLSYVALGIVVLFSAMLWLHKSAQPR